MQKPLTKKGGKQASGSDKTIYHLAAGHLIEHLFDRWGN